MAVPVLEAGGMTVAENWDGEHHHSCCKLCRVRVWGHVGMSWQRPRSPFLEVVGGCQPPPHLGAFQKHRGSPQPSPTGPGAGGKPSGQPVWRWGFSGLLKCLRSGDWCFEVGPARFRSPKNRGCQAWLSTCTARCAVLCAQMVAPTGFENEVGHSPRQVQTPEWPDVQEEGCRSIQPSEQDLSTACWAVGIVLKIGTQIIEWILRV